MPKIPQDDEDQIDAAAQAVALGLAKLISEVMTGKKRISVISMPFGVLGIPIDGGVCAYRHTIEVEDLEPIVMDCATGGHLTDVA